MTAELDLIDSLPVAAFATDAEGRVVRHNAAAAALWGQSPDPGTARWTGAWRLLAGGGGPLDPAASPAARTLAEGRPAEPALFVAERPDGSRTAFVAHPSLLRDGAGRPSVRVRAAGPDAGSSGPPPPARRRQAPVQRAVPGSGLRPQSAAAAALCRITRPSASVAKAATGRLSIRSSSAVIRLQSRPGTRRARNASTSRRFRPGDGRVQSARCTASAMPTH